MNTNYTIIQFNKDTIEQYIKNGWLRRSWNKDKSLQVLDYTQKTTFEEKWDDITTACRGIVLDKECNVIMPCIPKFFNYEQLPIMQRLIVQDRFVKKQSLITKKYDGCLAAIFPYKDELIITSKCSFDSFVVDAAKDILKDCSFDKLRLKELNIGLVCEIIHPDTHILVDYGDLKEIRVITAFNLNDKTELSYQEVAVLLTDLDCDKLKMVEQVKFSIDELEEWQETHDATEEGFVVRFQDNFRVKFKSKEYLNCAKIASHITPSAFVDYILENWDEEDCFKPLENRIAAMPDEVQKEAKEILYNLRLRFAFLFMGIEDAFLRTKYFTDKQLGLCQDETIISYKSYIFDKRKGKDINKRIVKDIIKEAR